MRRLLIALGLLLVPVLVLAQAVFVETATGDTLTVAEAAQKLLEYDVVFFGEYHDNAILHHMEINLLKAMHEKDPNLVVSMEMFERDVQTELSLYTQGITVEKFFLENTRPWSNYETDYRPVVEFAKENQLPVIAANVPRDLAAKVSRGGMDAFDGFNLKEKQNSARKLTAPDDEYKKRFMETMSGGMHPMGKLNMDYLYLAQCLKDDTMAESVANFLERFPDKKVIHFNGDFHSNSHLGTVSRLEAIKPGIKIAVITPAVKPLESQDTGMGEFLIPLDSE